MPRKKESKVLYGYSWEQLSGRTTKFYHTDDVKFLAVTHNAVDVRDTYDRILAWGTDRHEVERKAKQELVHPNRDRELSVSFRIVEPTVSIENPDYK